MPRIRVGVWFDGSYFSKVSGHFLGKPGVERRLDIKGVLELAKRQVARLVGVNDSDIVLTQKKWFRGRFPAAESERAGMLLPQARFEDLLRNEGFCLSFHPVQEGSEKEVDVAIAVDVTKAAINEEVDAVVLFSGDGDFRPALTTARSYGRHVVVIGADERQINPAPKIAGRLSDAVDLVVNLCGHEADRSLRLWLEQPIPTHPAPSPSITTPSAPVSRCGSVERSTGTCTGVYYNKGGYGFIKDDDGTDSVWFPKTNVILEHFNQLSKGVKVTYKRQRNNRGYVANDVQVASEPNSKGGAL